MSNRDKVVELINKVPDYKIEYIIAYIQGIIDGEKEPLPLDTLEAFKQVENNEFETFSSSEELFKNIGV